MNEYEIYQLYAETLDIQAMLCRNESIRVLSSLPEFANAKTILEVGCGGGAQVAALSEILRDKTYLGIDLSPELLLQAQMRASQHITFEQANLFEFSEQFLFDFVLCFAVLQHLPDVQAALQKLAALINNGGVLAIFDANGEEEFQSYPEIPELRKMYRSISEEKTGEKEKACASSKPLRHWHLG